ncbi:MAG: hypothetical protein IT260_05520 [Saprospiraceae bacterium]|nr:hypothetical protein [Saprospiraceae bacterium]
MLVTLIQAFGPENSTQVQLLLKLVFFPEVVSGDQETAQQFVQVYQQFFEFALHPFLARKHPFIRRLPAQVGFVLAKIGLAQNLEQPQEGLPVFAPVEVGAVQKQLKFLYFFRLQGPQQLCNVRPLHRLGNSFWKLGVKVLLIFEIPQPYL